ncbi:MAG: outer membrane protein assembly factor BamD [Terriglobales bacterium]
MFRRFQSAALILLLALTFAGCRKNKTQNPLADLDSKQPDKVLFDRAMEALKRNKFDVARLTLQTMINTYPDSEFVARAKLAVGDAWYAEGGSAALAQAEVEYKDFITFFPNMSEAAEAQLKVANIHYKQMEKPDRDFTHAKRAEDEYKELILQFPDSPLVGEARSRLMEVQEVLAEREFRIGRFYFLRQSWAASIARLKSLADTYPLYSLADETLFLLGSAYEQQIEVIRAGQFSETAKAKLIQEFTDSAAEAYSRIVTRYPAMERAEDAKERLVALKRPVPTPTPEAIAQNEAEEKSRGETGTFGRIMGNFRRNPNMTRAAKVGEPTMVEPKITSAPEIIKQATRTIQTTVAAPGSSSGSVAVEVVHDGAPPPSDPVPSSTSPQLIDSTKTPAQAEAPPPAMPSQVNYADPDEPEAKAASSSAQEKDGKNVSTSKKKKKKGLRKIVPF